MVTAHAGCFGASRCEIRNTHLPRTRTLIVTHGEEPFDPERMTVTRFAFVVLAIAALVGPLPADSQLVGGVFGTRARDSFGGTNGFGAEAGVSLPLLPIEVVGSGTHLNPSCIGCVLSGWSLGVKFQMPLSPVVRSYVTVGRTWRDLEDPSDGLMLDDEGIFAGPGMEIVFPETRAGIFFEGRYEFLTSDSGPTQDLRQWVWRAGLTMRWGGLPLLDG